MMERLAQWILAHPDETGYLVSFLVTALVIMAAALLRQRGLAGIRESLKGLMLLAERKRRKGELPFDGPQVMDWVIRQALIYVVPAAPRLLRPFLTEQRLRLLAQTLFDKATDWIDDGRFDGSNKSLADSGVASEVAAAFVKELDRRPSTGDSGGRYPR